MRPLLQTHVDAERSSLDRVAPGILVAGIVIWCVLWWVYPHDLLASDPWLYSRRAFAIAHDSYFGRGDIFDARLGVTGPVALCYALFGVSIYTTNLVPLLASIAIMLVVWLALPDSRSRVAGLLLCVTCPPLFRATTDLYPDVVTAAFLACSTLLLTRRDRLAASSTTSAFAWGAFAALLSVLAALAKVTAYWVLPLWLLTFVKDARSPAGRRLLLRWYLPVAITALALTGLYLWFCHKTWGDPLILLHSTEAVADKHLWAFDGSWTPALRRRLTTGPWLMLIRRYGAFLTCMLALALALALARSRSREAVRPWAIAFGSGLALYWFGPTSSTGYSPLPLMERMVLPLLPAGIIIAADTLSRLPGGVLSSTRGTGLVLAVLFCFQLTPMLNTWPKRSDARSDAHAMAIVREAVNAHQDEHFLLMTADKRSSSFLTFYFGYEVPKNLSIVAAENLHRRQLRAQHYYSYEHTERSRFLNKSYGTNSDVETVRDPKFKIVFKRGPVVLRKKGSQAPAAKQ